MSVSDAPFRRLLRWYPRSWRDSNGEIFVATLMEAAEHDGRAAPAPADVWGAVLHGTGARLTARLALVLSIVALALSVAAGVMYVWTLGGGTAAVLLPLLTIGIIPLLTAISAVAVVRDRGLVGDGRAIVMVVLSVPALVLAGLAAWSWSLGFDAADAGTPAPPLDKAWLPLIGAGLIIGVASLGLFIDSVLSRTQLPRFARITLSLIAACMLTPIVGFALLTPYVAAVGALATAVLAAMPHHAAMPHRAAVRMSSSPPRPHGKLRTSPRAARATARVLALIAALGGFLGVAYALTGSHWSPGASDGTVAMAQGITLLLIAAIPLIAAFGVWTDGRGAQPSRHVWGPLVLLAAALVLIAVAYTHAPEWDSMAPWFFAGSVLAGGAISWWIIPRTRLPRVAAVIIGIFSGLLYAAFLGMILTPLLAFTVPLLGILMFLAVRPSGPGALTVPVDEATHS